MTYRVKNIGIAVILAAFAGLLTIFYVTQYKRHVQHGETKVSVLVAARDIPAGTTGAEVVGQHYLSTETVPRRTVVPGAVSSSDQLNNLVVTQQIFAGEQVTTRAFGTSTELGIRAHSCEVPNVACNLAGMRTRSLPARSRRATTSTLSAHGTRGRTAT